MCNINCSGGCPECAPEEHDEEAVRFWKELQEVKQQLQETVESYVIVKQELAVMEAEIDDLRNCILELQETMSD